ncbi:hypothetical protein PPERSA_07718 [Pseudocohnilembus persalinus]|uniref:tRNA (adenine(58)-N(1))-methyltransferase non-catalytic subunit TRM6 n=1 Tax=Pseudocohnilembus persalinus TaxID=266149 RepID=A0A0V0R9M9_PSEPJ|nr:hypothetical protein PPERSA_07718 [Pseudocohnilembus persalinus]|eukprot:KRX11193.1 hypothetical protein PPERSA_07718 [Pseudocohnilembus persalinus]
MEGLKETETILGKEWIILIDNRKESRIINLKQDKRLNWRKQHLKLDQLKGLNYNQVYEIEKGKFKENPEAKKEFYHIEVDEQFDEQMETEGKDNRNIKSNRDENNEQQYQQLTKEEIEKLKQEGAISKQQLVQKIVESNVQMEMRTANLRHDSFAYFLYQVDAQPGSRILMFDNTKGLAVGGVAQRLNGQGQIHLAHNPNFDSAQKKNQTLYLTALNPSQQVLQSVQVIPSSDLSLVSEKYSHLVVCGSFDALEIVQMCNDLLEVGGNLVMYSPHTENLIPVYNYLVQSKEYIYIQMTDSFMRQYQILKERTHPMVEISSFSGYVLRAVKVEKQ